MSHRWRIIWGICKHPRSAYCVVSWDWHMLFLLFNSNTHTNTHITHKRRTIKWLRLDVDRCDLETGRKNKKTKRFEFQFSFFWFVFHSHSTSVCLLNALQLWGMKLKAPCAWNNVKWLYQRFASLYSTCEYASYTETRDLAWSRISLCFLRVAPSVVSSSVTMYTKDIAAAAKM